MNTNMYQQYSEIQIHCFVTIHLRAFISKYKLLWNNFHLMDRQSNHYSFFTSVKSVPSKAEKRTQEVAALIQQQSQGVHVQRIDDSKQTIARQEITAPRSDS